jgi:NAD-dependent deacetylase
MDLERFLMNRKVPRLVFATGAGLSAESGIRTFRDSEDGLWEEYDIDDVCNISTFESNYKLVHKFYSERRQQLSTVHPNDAHGMIADFQKRYGDDRVIHITANVDDLAERAGGSAMHVHGNLREVIEPWSWNDYAVKDIGYNDFIPTDGIKSKPNVVMFGECFRYEHGLRKELYTDRDEVLASLSTQDTVIVIGSSDTVICWSILAGMGTPAYAINVNPEKHDNDYMFQHNIFKTACNAIDDIKNIVIGRM